MPARPESRSEEVAPRMANNGRVPGRRGQETRQRLLRATVELLSSTPWRSVKVIDIARRAGTSPATFYQYFDNVEAAVGVLVEEMVEQAASLAEVAEGDWSPGSSWETARSVTEGFLQYWEDNRAVFRVMEVATAEGDAALQGVRVRALNAITVALADVIARDSPAGADPMAVAGALVAMLASVSAHRYGFEFWGIRTADLMDVEARFLHWAVTGRSPEAPPPRRRGSRR